MSEDNEVVKEVEEGPREHWPPVRLPFRFDDKRDLHEAVRRYVHTKGIDCPLGPIGTWDVSNISNMSQLFCGCSTFNESLENWDVSHVVNMSSMFYGCYTFNQPLANWDVSNVVNMEGMFQGCHTFNQPLADWDVSCVESTYCMFDQCHSFNQPLADWNVSNVTSMYGMFCRCPSFNHSLFPWTQKNTHPHVMNAIQIDRIFLNTNQTVRCFKEPESYDDFLLK